MRTVPAPDGHGSGPSKAHAQVPKPIPVDIPLPATGPFRQNTDIENFINDVASHYDVSDHAQAPGFRRELLLAGMKRSAINLSRSEFEVFTFGTKYDLSESAIEETFGYCIECECCLAFFGTWNVIYCSFGRLVLIRTISSTNP